jgi:hypothetical protein
VEPGTFSVDVTARIVSLTGLKAIVAEGDGITVHPDNQAL